MKNLNPRSGLRQLISGYFPTQRKFIFELVQSGKLSANELGYYLIFITSADWDRSEHRKAFIRHSIADIAKLWSIKPSTLRFNLNKLVERKLIAYESNTPKIVDFDEFTLHRAQNNKVKLTDEELDAYFSYLKSDSNILNKSEFRNCDSFKSSFKSGFNSSSVNGVQQVRSEKEYESDWLDMGSPDEFTPEDMKWIDENLHEDPEVVV